MNILSPFHLAISVHDLKSARTFYGDILGLSEGRSSDHWIDYDFWGHQFVVHLDETRSPASPLHTNPVDGHDVPVPHFGLVLPWEQWESLSQRLADSEIQFAIEPHIRFKGEPGEQATMFFYDPSGNALEFKAFKDLNQLFAK